MKCLVILQTSRRCFLSALFVTLVSMMAGDALAQGKGNNKSKDYRLVPLSFERGRAFAMNEAETTGNTTTVDVVGELLGLPAHWRVTATGSSQTIVTTLLTMHPDLFIGSMVAKDLNQAGIIVGHGYPSGGTLHGMVWKDSSADPMLLPMPEGFVGWGVTATHINNPTAGSGIILGRIDGMVPDGENGLVDTLGIIVWRYSFDLVGDIVISPPTWFEFSDQAEMKIGMNDAGWIALTNGNRAHRYRLDWDWVWDPNAGSDGGFVEVFYLAESEGDMFGENVQWAKSGGINQAGDAVVFRRVNGSLADELVAKRLNGNLISFPVYATHRDEVTRIDNIYSINDATSAHGVQVIGRAGKYNTRNGSYHTPRPAIWEAGKSVRLLQDITDFPSDAQYNFLWLGQGLYDLNNVSWICGESQRNLNGQSTNIPTVLIRNQ